MSEAAPTRASAAMALLRPLYELGAYDVNDMLARTGDGTYALPEGFCLPPAFAEPGTAKRMLKLLLSYAARMRGCAVLAGGRRLAVAPSATRVLSIPRGKEAALVANMNTLRNALTGTDGRALLAAMLLSVTEPGSIDSAQLNRVVMEQVILSGLLGTRPQRA